MRIILLQNIKGLGRIGDVKNVADGYGRNFLIARGSAKVATEDGLNEAETLRKKAEASAAITEEKIAEFAEKAKTANIEFTKKAGKTGKLYSSVTKEEIAEELSRALGGKIKPEMINLREHGEHIKQAGEHMIEIEFTPNLKTEIKITVKSDY